MVVVMAILVTGGTGLVGSQLIEDLIEYGHPPSVIRALVRPPSDTILLQRKGVQLCYGDVLDLKSLTAAVRDVHTVFHCAGAVTEKRKQLFWQINFYGTERMLEAARLSGVKKFIHVSTIGIYGLLQKTPATEDHPKNPLRPYAVAKLAAEEKVWEYYRTHGLKSVALRPTAIVGERDRTITKRLVALARRKVVPVIDRGKAGVSFVDVRDLTRAMILASECENAVGKAYNVQGFSAPIRDVVQFFIRAVGSRARIIDVPYALAYAGAFLIDGFYAMVRSTHHPIRARKGVQQLTRDLTFDTTRIRTDLHFEPRYGMDESFRRAIQWQLEHGN
ncbi:MAG: NAD-dependent epimerase/dehydratase family protein [Acidobacteria bacterium]|nr:NAD-dependent epimerase/dehydratase family protein [Acidobacteriota bacterium]